MSAKKRAFVTGADGFIGSHLVKFLDNKEWEVIGGFLHRNLKQPFRDSGIRFVQCDLRDAQRVKRVLRQYRPTHVFHLGAQSLPTVSWADPVGTFESNIMGSLHLLEAIRHMEDRPVVVSACSSPSTGMFLQRRYP